MVDKCGVTQPISEGVPTRIRLHDERVFGVKVEAFDLRNLFAAITEKQRKVVWIFSFGLDEVSVRLYFRKGPERDVIGQKVRVLHLIDGFDMQRVGPKGVLPHVWFRGCRDEFVREGHLLTLLVEDIVTVGILQSKHSVASVGDTADGEASSAVGSRHAQHGLFAEDAVTLVGIQPHEDALDGLKVLGFKHISAYLHGVYLIACGETVSVIAQWVALVVVRDGITEVDGIGGIGLQTVFQFHENSLSLRFNLRRFQLWRRHYYFLGGILQFDKLIEIDVNFLARYLCGTFFW